MLQVFIQKILEASKTKTKERQRYLAALGGSQRHCQDTAIAIISAFGKVRGGGGVGSVVIE